MELIPDLIDESTDQKMNEDPSIRELFFVKESVVVLFDGHEITVKLADISAKLLTASDIEHSIYKISSSGYGIHWPLINEDISVNELLKRIN